MASSKNFMKNNEIDKCVKKSILRNPEVSKGNKDNINKHVFINDVHYSNNGENDEDSKILHQPRINKLADMRKTLSDIKSYEAREITSMDELNRKTQDLINRAVSTNLNFPHNQTVFKNLPSINDDDQCQQHVQKFQKRSEINEKNDKRDEIIKYIKEMMIENEKKDNKNFTQQKVINLQGENEFLGLCQKKDPLFMVPSRKTESKRFQNDMISGLYKSIGINSDEYNSKVRLRPFIANSKQLNRIENDEEKSCKCLEDFYAQHLNCS